MYEHLKGKKLLIIGSAIEEEIVKAAHEMGIYTIVADNVTDRKIARAKVISDEAWDISFFDTDELADRCRKAGVEGVFAGYGEFRVIAASRLAKALGLPYYASEEQIELTRNKNSFKKKCMEYDIPVPQSYCKNGVMTPEERSAVRFPVIVKPSDRSGRIGISICRNQEEFEAGIAAALEKSESGTYVVEDYLAGTEFSAVYTLSAGEISLSCLNAKYITEDQKVPNFLCDCAISPAWFIDRFEAELDGKLKAFLRGIGLKNGMANIQGMFTENGFYVFEMGMRINGNNDWKVIDRSNGINFVKMMIAHSLTGDMCDDLKKDNPRFSKFYCTCPIFAHEGTIGEFSIDKVISQPWAQISNVHVEAGSVMHDDGTNRQKLCAILMEADDLEQLKERIAFMQANIVCRSVTGENMLFQPFNAAKLRDFR